MIEVLVSFGYGIMVGLFIATYLRRRKAADTSRDVFARSVITSARKVKEARQFVGEGPAIYQDCVWTITGIGRFKVRLEEEGPA